MRKIPPTIKLDTLIDDPDLNLAIQGMEISAEDAIDFLKIFKVLSLQMEGMSVKNAVEEAGMGVNSFYRPKNRELANLARRILTAKVMVGVDNLVNRIYERMPEMIDSMINVALNGGKDHEKVAAMELLWKMYPGVAGSREEAGEKSQSDYLKKASARNFNPMTPVTVNVQPGATITLSNTSGDTIDITPDSRPD